jgi:hypothetical protein
MGRGYNARLGKQLILLLIAALILYHRLYHHLLVGLAIDNTIFANVTAVEISFLPPLPRNQNRKDKRRPNQSSGMFDLDATVKSSSPPWAFFYNVYMPKDQGKGNTTLVYHILDEQLHQVADSYAANYQNKSLTVYYNTIGQPVNQSFVQEVCHQRNPRMRCVHMEHFDQAFEEKTLARVHEYCQHNPNNRVGYIHNKGSYNSRNARNHWWRRHMTLAVTDRDCMSPPDSRCNICGLNFYALPFIHFSGNFFTAHCSYINKLLPIEVFRRKMSVLANQTLEYEQQGRFLFHTFRNQDTYMGLDRYASEAWPGSHPSIVACDVSVERQVDFWKRPQEEAFDYWNFSLAPRPTDISGKFLHIRRTLRNKDTYRMREYWLLAGNVFKWTRLYNQVPPESSWVWGFYPDGGEWLNGYKMFGNDVVEVLLDPFAMEDGNLSMPIYENVKKYHRAKQRYREQRARQRARRLRRRELEEIAKLLAR